MKILIDGQTLSTPEMTRGIGRYFINVLSQILTFNFSDQFFLTLEDEDTLNIFPDFIKNKLHILKSPLYNPQNCSSHDYSNQINSDIAANHIDIYWTPNPLMTNVHLVQKHSTTKFCATVFDVIPLALRQYYLDKWPSSLAKDYIDRVNFIGQNYDLLFHISQYSKDDFLKFCPNYKCKNIVTQLAAQDNFTPDPFPKTFSQQDYILYLGGFDPRKNMYKALKAFSIFQKKFPAYSNYQLCIVCTIDLPAKQDLLSYAKKLKVDKKLVFTDYISDEQLLLKFQKAKAFFYPSLYEGFGLPILEALACGIPVACSRNSSLTEIGQDQVNYLDPNDTDSMAQALFLALQEPLDFDSKLKRQKYSRTFSWQSTAQNTIKGFQSLIKRDTKRGTAGKKDTYAWLSPLPPQQSGISHYSSTILKQLCKNYSIDVYYDNVLPDKNTCKDFNLIPIEKFSKNYSKYREVFYNIGNSPDFHSTIYQLAWENPGTTILHDYNLQPFLDHAFLRSDKQEFFYSALCEGYGLNRNLVIQKTINGVDPSLWEYSMSHAIVKRSKRTIVHNQWVRNQFSLDQNIDVIPMFCEKVPKINIKNIENIKDKYQLKENDFILSVLGFINWNKHPESTIKAVADLIKKGYPIKLIFAGRLSDDLAHLKEYVLKNGLSSNVIFTDYIENQQYFAIISLSDLVINLRNPTMGESSLTLMQSLSFYKPTIISNINQYKEFPENVCIKVTHDDNEVAHISETISHLLTQKEYRHSFCPAIKEYIQYFSPDYLSSQYIRD